jgi:hypothetical protein
LQPSIICVALIAVSPLPTPCANRWDYLTEKFAYEKRVKENKLKVAMMQVSAVVVKVTLL